jgi:hypothetical protein
MYIHQKVELAGISPGVGWLGDLAASPDKAEVERLKEQMRKLAVENKWRGVERSYQDWLKLNAAVDWEFYFPAVGAAKDLGCGTVRYLRLIRALGANPPSEVARLLAADKKEMELGWAHVDIRLRRKATGDLQAVEGLPFAADKSKAIARAQKELKEKGKFDDLLPAIPYTIDGHAVPLGPDFAISRGVSVVNIDQKGDGAFQFQSKPGRFNYLRTPDECPL